MITGAEGGKRLTDGATLSTGGEVKSVRFAALEFGGSGGAGGAKGCCAASGGSAGNEGVCGGVKPTA